MCGRYVSPGQAAIEREWHIGRRNNHPFERRFNVQPSAEVPILLRAESRLLELATARWGLIPHWWKEARPPKYAFNARLEEAATKPMWRHSMRHARCLVPAEGWYEWQAIERTDPATGEIRTIKQPHFIRGRDARLVCFAGLMSVWSPPDAAGRRLTCAILTTAAAGPVAEVHDRMPVVLDGAAHDEWLDPAIEDAQRIAQLARGHALSGELVHYPVRTLVNSSRAEGEELIEPLASARGEH